MRDLTAIAAVCANGVIGADGDQPWRDRDDFARFKRLTMGNVLVMGRKTFEAIGRALPGRHTIVLTRSATWRRPGVRTAVDLRAALDLARRQWPDSSVFIAGGGEVYREAMPLTTRLEITEVHQELPGDVTFPQIEPGAWTETHREALAGFDWVTYLRCSPE